MSREGSRRAPARGGLAALVLLRTGPGAAGAPPETAEVNSQLHFHAFSSGALGVLNDDVIDVTGRPPVSFAEFAAGAVAAWRRQP